MQINLRHFLFPFSFFRQDLQDFKIIFKFSASRKKALKLNPPPAEALSLNYRFKYFVFF